MKRIETRKINGQRVKFYVWHWECPDCDAEGIIRVPEAATDKAMYQMAHADHSFLLGGSCAGGITLSAPLIHGRKKENYDRATKRYGSDGSHSGLGRGKLKSIGAETPDHPSDS